MQTVYRETRPFPGGRPRRAFSGRKGHGKPVAFKAGPDGEPGHAVHGSAGFMGYEMARGRKGRGAVISLMALMERPGWDRESLAISGLKPVGRAHVKGRTRRHTELMFPFADVNAAEACRWFRARRESVAMPAWRRAKAGMGSGRDEMVNAAEVAEVVVTRHDKSVFFRAMVEHDRRLAEANGRLGRGYVGMGPSNGKAGRDKVVVAYIKHNVTSYERAMLAIKSLCPGRPLGGEAYFVLNRRVYEAIAKVYPELADACRLKYSEKLLEARMNGFVWDDPRVSGEGFI